MSTRSVYIETSVLSYLAARSSRDVIVLGQQQLTVEWWESEREKFSVYVSTVVVEEASMGDGTVAQRRLEFLLDVEVLEVNEAVVALAERLVTANAIPQKAAQDALHIAVASVHGIHYLLTWNYKHIANALMREAIDRVCRTAGYEPPIICTPAELGGSNVG